MASASLARDGCLAWLFRAESCTQVGEATVNIAKYHRQQDQNYHILLLEVGVALTRNQNGQLSKY